MTSNFLGDVRGEARRASAIISGNELIAREGVNLQKGMNFRDTGGLLAVFLVLSREGVFQDEWSEDTETYVFQGHDSTTTENGKLRDQIAMYQDGRVTDNGKFYKAAIGYKDGAQREPMQIQMYEKLDPGVWYDKGIFNLIDARHVEEAGRKVFKFHLRPADASDRSSWDQYRAERFLPVAAKVAAWTGAGGRCEKCGSESELHFVGTPPTVHLYCKAHAS